MIYHVLNRGVGRMRLFHKLRDYAAFEEILDETLAKNPLRVCAYCLMPNHWHFVVWPEDDGQLATFLQRLTVTHVTRWARAKLRVGYGHVYQGRFKSFPVETDEYFYQVMRLRETQCPARQPGGGCGAVALVEPMDSGTRLGRTAGAVVRLAHFTPAGLAPVRE